jgi:hypothetical protein
MTSTAFEIITSAACSICGEVYGLLLPTGVASAAVRAHDCNCCARCAFGDDVERQGLIGEQVIVDFECFEPFDEGLWKYQEDMAVKERARLAERYPPPTVETRTCPACLNDFEVEVHGRRGRLNLYCCTKCKRKAENARYRRGVSTI